MPESAPPVPTSTTAVFWTNSSPSYMACAESPERVIHRFASLLETAGVPYMLTGSFASGFHGAPRATQDIDIVITPNLGSLNQLLRLLPDDQYYVSPEAARDAYGRESPFNVVDFASGWKVDLICRKARAFSVAEFERRTRLELAGVGIFIASAEDVVLAKLEGLSLLSPNANLKMPQALCAFRGRLSIRGT